MPAAIPLRGGRDNRAARPAAIIATLARAAGVRLAGLSCAAPHARSGALAALAFALPAPAHAASTAIATGAFGIADAILLAVFGGAMSFAILAASWLIRERARMATATKDMNSRLADLRASAERSEALINVADQRIVVWGGGDKPAILGQLSDAAGGAAARADFLAFGRWLAPDSARPFEAALAALRANATPFDMPLVTRVGAILEAQGRTSGGFAFVRFVELSGERRQTSRLEAEQGRLRARLEAVEELFSRLPAPVWLRDNGGALLYANAAYARAVDRADTEALLADPVELFDQPQRRAVGDSEARQGYFSGPLPAVVAGDRRMLDVTAVRTATAAAGIAIDRGEAEALADRLARSEDATRRILDHLSSAIAIFDGRQRLQFANAAFAKLWGLDEIFIETRPDHAALLDAMRAGRKLPERPDWRKWRDGQLAIYRAIEGSAEDWHLAGGETLRVFANPQPDGGAALIFENVTEQVALVSNYNALVRVQGETLDHLNEAVAVYGQDGRLRLSNPAFAAMWRLPAPATAAGAHVKELKSPFRARLRDPADWDTFLAAVAGIDENRTARQGRADLVDGSVVDFALAPLPAGQCLMTFLDVTANVNVERALKERNEALEQSDNLKNRFIGHVSRELRTPLTSIAGFSEILAMGGVGKLNARQSEYLAHIVSASDALKALIDDILDLATIDAGAMTLDIRQGRIRPEIDACLAALADRLSLRGLRAEIDIAGGADEYRADPGRLRQILYNLLSHAVAASPDGGRIAIGARRARDALEVSVNDEGPAIGEEDKTRLFGRFEERRGEGARRSSSLGLSIVKSLAELHGGSVRIEAGEPCGARIVLSLPARDAPKAA
jgi:signal transduction histidine kinase